MTNTKQYVNDAYSYAESEYQYLNSKLYEILESDLNPDMKKKLEHILSGIRYSLAQAYLNGYRNSHNDLLLQKYNVVVSPL